MKRLCLFLYFYSNDYQHEQCVLFLYNRMKQYHFPKIFPQLTLVDLYSHPQQQQQATFNSFDRDALRQAYNPLREVAKNALMKWLIAYAYSHKKSGADSAERNGTLTQGSAAAAEQAAAQRAAALDLVPPNFMLIRRVLFCSKTNINLM